MIISDSEEFVFVHNPKCAGTTVRKSLLQFDTRSNHYWMFGDLYGRKVDKAHMPYGIACQFDPSVKFAFENYAVFGFVRNPISRTISAFNETHNRLLLQSEVGQTELDEYIDTLNDFVLSLTKERVSGLNFRYRHFVKQSLMFFDGKKSKADLIVKLEDLKKPEAENSIVHLVPCLKDVAPIWNQAKKNIKNVKMSSKDILTKPAMDKIFELYEDDFLMFGYSN